MENLSNNSFPFVYTLRIVQGLTQSVLLPFDASTDFKVVAGKEKSKFVSFSCLGGAVGSVVTFSLGRIWIFLHNEALISKLVYKIFKINFSNALII